MVKRNRWLDITPQGSKATANRGIRVDQWLTGTVTEQVDSSNVAVELDGSDSTPVVAPAAAGITYIGARVRVLRDSTGRIVQVEAPLDLPEGVETIAVGSTGWAILDAQSGVNETQEALDQAKAELEEKQSQLATELEAADQRITDAATEATQKYALLDQTRQDVEQVRDTAQGAADLAAQTAEDAIISVVTEYAVGSSETVAPTSGWSTSAPARTPGTFIWSRTITTKGDGTQSTSSPVLVTGNTGSQGPQGVAGPAGKDGADGTSVTIQGSVASASALPTGLGSEDAGKGWLASDTGHLHVWSGSSWTDVGAVRGPEGATAYVHMAWATSSAGANFSTSYFSGATHMGMYSDHTQADSTTASDYTWALVQGPRGQTGATGAAGAAGADGKDGAPGKDGVGLSGTVISYAKSTSGTSVPSSGWQATVPSSTPGQYLWTRTVWSYTDGTSETGYSVAMWGATGAKGDTGSDGVAGKDGVGISSTSIMYAASSSGTTAPTSGWASAPPSASAGQYVWTRTVWTYTDGTTETGYSVGKIGNTGAKGATGAAGVSVSSVTPYYVLVGTGASAPAKPTTNPPSSSWTLTEPSYQSNTELYRCDLTVMSDGTWSWGAVSKVSSYTAANAAMDQAVSGSVEVRRNLVLNPRAVSGFGYWASTNSMPYTYTTIDDAPAALTTNSGSADSLGISASANTGAIAVDTWWALAIEVYPSKDTTVTMGLRRAGDATAFAKTGIAVNGNTWTRLTLVGKATTATTDSASIRVEAPLGSGMVSGDTLAGRKALVMGPFSSQAAAEGANLDYFDGSYSPDPDLTPSWTGMANASASVLTRWSQALTVANLAQASAQGLVKASQTDPGHAVGRIWFVLNDAGNVIGMKISNGSAWSSYAIITEDLMVVGSDGTIRLKDGVVSGTNLVFDNAFVTGLMATDAFLTSLWSSKVTVSGENLWKNQRFDPLGPVIGAVSDQTPPVGNARLCNSRDHWNSAGAFDVTPGDKLVVEVTAKRTAGARALRGGLWWTGTSGKNYDGLADFGDVGVVSGDWHRYRRTITVPANKSRATLYIQIEQDANTGYDTTWHVADATIRRAVGGELIVDGAVTASKVTASEELSAKVASFLKVTTDMLIAGGAQITGALLADVIQLATRLVAGDPDGTRVELNETGLSVWRMLADGMAAQAINLGITEGGDYLTILSSGGDTVASIDEDGNVSGQVVSASDSMLLSGADLGDTINALPQGAIAKTYLNTSAFQLTSDAQTILSTDFTLPGSGDRQIRVTISVAHRSNGEPVLIQLHGNASGTATSGNSIIKAWQDVGSAQIQSATYVYEFNSDELSVDPDGDRFLSFAISGKTSAAGSTAGNVSIRGAGYYETSIAVEDIGAAVPTGKQATTSSGSAKGSLTKTKTYTATASRSYQSSGAAYGFGGSRVFQGSYGSNTGLRGMWIFPTSILSDLSGATVNKVILRLTNQHTYYNSGATARIVTHSSTSLPSTWSSPGSVIASVAFAKGQTRDIDLTSALKAGLKSGSIRGVGLYSTSSADYGYWSPTAKLIITYTK